jgi:peptide/nickel transport system ATP-binding protein
MSDAPPVLAVRDLTVDFRTRTGDVHALERVGFEVPAGAIMGIVGESGSGKSVTAFAVMGLLDRAARVQAGEIRFGDTDLLRLKPARLDELRGRDIAMVFQNPRAALNPVRPIGTQIADVIARHQPAPARQVRERVLAALRAVRIPDPKRRLRAYPFELSGGMCQRVGIAMALACRPRLLIADELTTGLDVTTQAVVMDLFRDAVRAEGASAILITHDLALASEVCDRIMVMHAGHVVETAPVPALFAAPRHPYTARLLASVPSAASSIDALRPIEGGLPDLRRADLPPCRFSERCDRRAAICDAGPLPAVAVAPEHRVACWFPL